jgi:acylphosphatase
VEIKRLGGVGVAMGDGDVRAHVFVTGRVQGVGFRVHTQMQAESLGLTGWVRNVWDGRVEAVFEGPPHTIQRMVTWCHRGAPAAHVTNVEVHQGPATGEFHGFHVRH